MKPQNIYLIRHGESEGNIDKNSYASIPDYMLTLTDTGKQQAINTGKELRKMIKPGTKIAFYISPFWRTRMTFENIALSFDKKDITWKEDPRIREQEWGHLRD